MSSAPSLLALDFIYLLCLVDTQCLSMRASPSPENQRKSNKIQGLGQDPNRIIQLSWVSEHDPEQLN